MNWTMKRTMTWFVLVMTLTVSQASFALGEELKGEPGYVPFSTLDDVYGQPKVMVNIGNVLMKFLAAASGSDPELSEMIKGMQGIQINVYDTQGRKEPALKQLNEISDRLASVQWQPFIQVNEEDEVVQMLMKTDDEVVQGLVVMVVDREEAVFMNLVGAIDPNKLGKLMNQLDVDIDVDSVAETISESGTSE